MTKVYSLRKSRHILKNVYHWYKKKGIELSSDQLDQLEANLENLDQAIIHQDRKAASDLSHTVEAFADKHVKKSILDYSLEFIGALIFALLIATVVRQSWFELYEIPTGSMRPTFKEQDHLTVTKTAFGLNVPLKTAHFTFDPNLVQRTSVVIFSGDGLPMRDTETTYFWVFPYTKRYIKRLMGKPGDSLYFYGGQIYAIDKEGNPLTELLDSPWLKQLDHVPFLSFRGEVSRGNGELYFYQMHKPIGRVVLPRYGDYFGEVYNGKEWVSDNPLTASTEEKGLKTYGDFMGMNNYAMAKILSRQELKQQKGLNLKELEEGEWFLLLNHNPTLANLKNGSKTDAKTPDDLLISFQTVLPLTDKHLKTLQNNLYTARFTVANGLGTRYSADKPRFGKDSVPFPGVADGTYEFYYGKGYKVNFGAITTELEQDHPLYSNDPKNIQKLFNSGIELYHSSAQDTEFFPNRYAYFRNGDLFVMGNILMQKDDPVLQAFVKKENERESKSSKALPYVAFKDRGAPLKNGQIDSEFIRKFGITIPEKQYLVLGDNHAMSGDSRVFGFVPEANLQGAPSLIIWPPGERFGWPAQKPYALFVAPRLIIWSIAAVIALIWYLLHRRAMKTPIFKKITREKKTSH